MPYKLLLAGFACLFFSCSSSTIAETDAKNYNAQRVELAKQEKEKPLSFLRVYSSDKKNIFGGTVVKGVVNNTATVCSYKDVRMKLLSYDANGKIIEEHEDVLNGLIKPNDNKEFKLRYHLPRSADSVSISVMSASVAE